MTAWFAEAPWPQRQNPQQVTSDGLRASFPGAPGVGRGRGEGSLPPSLPPHTPERACSLATTDSRIFCLNKAHVRQSYSYIFFFLYLISIAEFLKTNLKKFTAIWVTRSQKAGFLRPISSKITAANEKERHLERRKRKSEEEERRRREKSNVWQKRSIWR